MDESLFQQYRDFIYKNTGITLGPDKKTLLENRIRRRLRTLNLSDEQEYFTKLVKHSDATEMTAFIDVVSTNTTSFFREPQHFEFLKKTVQQLLSKGQSKIRIWCAASSSGEEPYTITMTILEAAQGKQLDYKLLATDISATVLKQAMDGIYSAETIKTIPQGLVPKYFHPDGANFVASDRLKSHINFRRANLTQLPNIPANNFDIIFCRNVMIYFDQPVRQAIIDRFDACLKPGGLVIISHTESLRSIRHPFTEVVPSVYKKNI